MRVLTKAEYMRSYRRTPRARLSANVHITARTTALLWAKREHPIVWETLLWVASVEMPGYPPRRIRDRANVLLLSWIRSQHLDTWNRILDDAWAEVGGTLPGGAPRGRRDQRDPGTVRADREDYARFPQDT